MHLHHQLTCPYLTKHISNNREMKKGFHDWCKSFVDMSFPVWWTLRRITWTHIMKQTGDMFDHRKYQSLSLKKRARSVILVSTQNFGKHDGFHSRALIHLVTMLIQTSISSTVGIQPSWPHQINKKSWQWTKWPIFHHKKITPNVAKSKVCEALTQQNGTLSFHMTKKD